MSWGHAVKILGWGHELLNVSYVDPATNATKYRMEDTPYWLGANQWSMDWGEAGFFRIKHNDVSFDSSIGTQYPTPSAEQRKTKRSPAPAEEQLAHAMRLAA